MKLLIKRDTSMEHTRYNIYDESGSERYRITGKCTASIEKMIISDMSANALLTLRVARLPGLEACVVSDKKERFEMTVTSSKKVYRQLRFHGISWQYTPGSDNRSFEVFDLDGTCIMLQSADRYLSTGVLELTVNCEPRELFCIGAAVFADMVNIVDSAVTAPI